MDKENNGSQEMCYRRQTMKERGW